MGGDEAWELQAGYICRTRGAWLIIVHDPEGEALPDDEFTAASSLVVAKRVAVEMARGFGYTGRHTWDTSSGGSHILRFTGYDPEDR